MVIALTHQLQEVDEKLAANVPGLDMVLGGHDHIVLTESVKNVQNSNKDIPLIKSGSDYH